VVVENEPCIGFVWLMRSTKYATLPCDSAMDLDISLTPVTEPPYTAIVNTSGLKDPLQ
jgi:hypothetical protein